MKHILILFVCFLALKADAQSLIGKWKASPKGETVVLEFAKDSSFIMTHDKDTLGGKNFKFGEGHALTKFTVDTTHKPLHIDFMIMSASGQMINKMEGIYELVGTDKIRVRMSMDGSARPESFLPKGNEDTVVFVKQH